MSKAYQPLHHKYRPKRFDDLVGQQSIAATLKQALITNRIAPAYLFSGPRGTGKTSSARILARSLNCQSSKNPTPEPCGQCEICKTISLGTSLDVIEIDAASNTGVDNIRELIERSRFAPVQARWKVYVIDECHMLSTAAFNALLKTLEEPPEKVVFVLATTDPQRVLPTILSRCQCFDFRRIPIKEISKHLQMISTQEEISIETKALDLVAQRAQGGLRDAESMLDQLSLLPQPIKIESVWDLLGAIPEEELITLTNALSNKDPITLLETCRTLLDQGRDPLPVLQGLASILRDLVLLKAAPNRHDLTSFSNELNEQLGELANSLEIEKLFQWQARLKGTEYQLRQSNQPRLWLEVLLLGLLSENHVKEVSGQKIKTLPTEFLSSSKKQVLEDKSESFKSEDKTSETKPIIKDDLSTPNLESKENLSDLWRQILGKLELPSTRMLLSQQAKLVSLTASKVVVEVSSNWIGMVQSRVSLIETAINETLGGNRKLLLESTLEKSFSNSQDVRSISTNQTVDEDLESDKKVQSNLSIQKSSTSIPKKEKESDLIQEKPAINNVPHNDEEIDNKAKNLAEFFNGKVLDIEI